MSEFILSLLAALRVFLRSRSDTALEILALRQQVAVLKRKRPRPVLNSLDRFFWTTLYRYWSRWKDVLVIVMPDTVTGWHRAGFGRYWRWRSRRTAGRPRITDEIRALVQRLAAGNPDWGAPKIHGELQKLGFIVSERSVARYLARVSRRGDPGKKWLPHSSRTIGRRSLLSALLHRADPDVPVALLLLRHRTLPPEDPALQRGAPPDCGVGGPTAARSLSCNNCPYRYVILDRDSKFDHEVITFLQASGRPAETHERAGALAERTSGRVGRNSCRREILDHVIALSEQHLRRIVRDYVTYHHEDRIHRPR